MRKLSIAPPTNYALFLDLSLIYQKINICSQDPHIGNEQVFMLSLVNITNPTTVPFLICDFFQIPRPTSIDLAWDTVYDIQCESFLFMNNPEEQKFKLTLDFGFYGHFGVCVQFLNPEI